MSLSARAADAGTEQAGHRATLAGLPPDIHRVIVMYLPVGCVRSVLCAATLFSSQAEEFCADLCKSVHGWEEPPTGGMSDSEHLHLLEQSVRVLRWRHDGSTVVDGHGIISINVGGIARPTHRSFGQSPPAQGDTFTGPSALLRRGDYTFTVKGGINAHHGISTFSLCHAHHARETDIGSIDWYSRQTQNGVTFTLLVNIPRTEKVYVKCRMSEKSDDARNYWHAFSDFTLQRRQGC